MLIEKNNSLKENDEILKVKNITTGNFNENDTIKENNNSINKVANESSNKNFNGIIAILDIDGNVNFYENNILSKKFNLYDIKEINKEQKKKQFFSMGYAYYLKFNKNFICITSDHGCYVIKINYK